MRSLFLILMLFVVQTKMSAQNDEKIFSGIVVDAVTLSPLADVVVRTDGMAYGADEAGRVGLRAATGDTIRLSHVGYRGVEIVVNDTMYAQNIFSVKMYSDTVNISEVVVRPRPLRLAEMSQFMPLEHNRNDLVARYNVNKSAQIARSGSMRQWDAQTNQANTIGHYRESQINRHMIAPNQMVGISTASIALLVEMIRSMTGNDKKHNDVKPVDEGEILYLLGNGNVH